MTDAPVSPEQPPAAPASSTSGLSRRALFGGAGVLAGTLTGGVLLGRASVDALPLPPTKWSLSGANIRQGITTAAQDRLHFAAFDVITDSRADLVALLQRWTTAAERLTQGEETEAGGAVDGGEYRPPADTGEALGLAASNLTLTIGFGPGLFGPSAADPQRPDRFGIADRKPAALGDLPAFAAERIEPSRSYGDICIQACADDPQVAVHAVRNLARMGLGVVAVRWSQLGFGRTSSTTRDQQTPRNMFGFKDGTANIRADDTEVLNRWVWVQGEDNPASAQWMTGGTYLVARRIRMDIEPWDRASLIEQEQIVGRTKGTGAPLGQRDEFDTPDFALTSGGAPLIPATAHVRLAHPDNLNGVQILRRGYNFTDGSDGFGHLDAGLFFIAFNRDTGNQFVPMQHALSRRDAMTEYLIPNGSSVFAVPPGLGVDEWWGQHLFEG